MDCEGLSAGAALQILQERSMRRSGGGFLLTLLGWRTGEDNQALMAELAKCGVTRAEVTMWLEAGRHMTHPCPTCRQPCACRSGGLPHGVCTCACEEGSRSSDFWVSRPEPPDQV